MKISSAQFKLLARKLLLGRYGLAIGAQLVIYAVTVGVTIALEIFMVFGMIAAALMGDTVVNVFMIVVFAVVFTVIFMLEMMMMPGLIRMYMNMCKGQKAQVSDIFFVFRNRPGKFAGAALLLLLITAVIMIPNFVLSYTTVYTGQFTFFGIFLIIYAVMLTVLSIYVMLNYGMFYFILVEDPDKGIWEALSESRHLMNGNRGRYFCLGLSFAGWVILAYMTFGIGFLWLGPYLLCTSILFYLDLKPQVEVYPPQWQTDPAGWQMQQDMDHGRNMETVEPVLPAEPVQNEESSNTYRWQI